jgi:hypothetical protein
MRSKNFIWLLLALIQSLPALSQHIAPSPDTADQKLYSYALHAPTDITQDINKLVDYLKKPAKCEKDMVKSFSYWVMQNISYDISGYLNNEYNGNGITGTLTSKKGVCQDYSRLLEAMCDRAGIKCYTIIGYAKVFYYKPGSRFERTNHSWNMVKADGSYYLLDITWCSGCVAYANGTWRYIMKPDISHLFMSPELFVENHLPADPQWQLLNYPVSMDAFQRYNSHIDMLKEKSRYFNFVDSIGLYDSLDKDAQELKTAENAFKFYPVLCEYAYHYYNEAVTYSNTAIDLYNAAVTSYNKSITDNGGIPTSTGDYNKTVVSDAISNYSRAIKLLTKIRSYADSMINAQNLLQRCSNGLNASNELMKTLR